MLLHENVQGEERVVAYARRWLSEPETRYHSSEFKCLAVVWELEKFRPYFYGRSFVVVTDNAALTGLQSKKDITVKLARWALKLQEYSFVMKHRRGH